MYDHIPLPRWFHGDVVDDYYIYTGHEPKGYGEFIVATLQAYEKWPHKLRGNKDIAKFVHSKIYANIEKWNRNRDWDPIRNLPITEEEKSFWLSLYYLARKQPQQQRTEWKKSARVGGLNLIQPKRNIIERTPWKGDKTHYIAMREMLMDRYSDMSVLILPRQLCPSENYQLPEIIFRDDYIFQPLVLHTENDAHSNMIFWNNVKKTVHRFEPHGGNSPIMFCPKAIDEFVYEKMTPPGWTYIAPHKSLPDSLQTMEVASQENEIENENGYCALWSWVYVDLRLGNPDKDWEVIEAMLYNSGINLSHLARDLSTQVEIFIKNKLRIRYAKVPNKRKKVPTCNELMDGGLLCPKQNICQEYCRENVKTWLPLLMKWIFNNYGHPLGTFTQNSADDTDVYIDGLVFDMGKTYGRKMLDICYIEKRGQYQKRIYNLSTLPNSKKAVTTSLIRNMDKLLLHYSMCKRFGLLMRTSAAIEQINATDMFEMFQYIECGGKHYTFDMEGRTTGIGEIEPKSITDIPFQTMHRNPQKTAIGWRFSTE